MTYLKYSSALLLTFFIPVTASENNYYANDGEVVYLVENTRGILNAKIAKKKGKVTTGGIDEAQSELSDYTLNLSKDSSNKFSIILDKTIQQDYKCFEVAFTFSNSHAFNSHTIKSYAYISKLPKSLNTATQCKYLLLVNGIESKKIDILLNYSFKKWCQLNSGFDASKTAKMISNTCDTSLVKNLTTLDLAGKKIEDISSLSGLTKLKELKLEYNNLSYIPESIFSGLKDLEKIYLLKNQIKNLAPETFTNNKKLIELSLSYNNLSRLPENLFKELINLESLRLISNQISQLEPNIFAKNLKLQQLELSTNLLTSLPDNIFSELKELKKLKLNFNKINKLSSTIFSQNTMLVTLDLNGNELTSIPENLFKELNNLEVLMLKSNKIKQLSSATFVLNTKLKGLHLGHNDLTHIPDDLFTSSKNLESLWIHRNQISQLSSFTFAHNKKLKELALNHNLLTHIPNGIFSNLKELELLWINDNPVRNFDKSMLIQNPKLEKLTLPQ
ncbi:leucine-rich repeat domain-containing protein [Pigmentibacter sp. JX0631]|uniref:leucine-rich repeat domain-containing protein n=1 Tax=Pigmentibacter sp. JX0631 TaxID=2976982 RepID=UPI0024693475|nr:leucine-rich repeat domain-containing protein [Pigmentibacter sp. JX0631]WGL59749.1 leucine-rich repeat domain-containing protein [Pigmentibacter sp. JX0631]